MDYNKLTYEEAISLLQVQQTLIERLQESVSPFVNYGKLDTMKGWQQQDYDNIITHQQRLNWALSRIIEVIEHGERGTKVPAIERILIDAKLIES